MRRLALAAVVITLAACAPGAMKQVASKPAPILAFKCDSAASSFLVGGSQQWASCAAKTPVQQCEVLPSTRWYN
jgi:hypothetical protein